MRTPKQRSRPFGLDNPRKVDGERLHLHLFHLRFIRCLADGNLDELYGLRWRDVDVKVTTEAEVIELYGKYPGRTEAVKDRLEYILRSLFAYNSPMPANSLTTAPRGTGARKRPCLIKPSISASALRCMLSGQSKTPPISKRRQPLLMLMGRTRGCFLPTSGTLSNLPALQTGLPLRPCQKGRSAH